MALYACVYCGSHYCDDDCRHFDENEDSEEEEYVEDDYGYDD